VNAVAVKNEKFGAHARGRELLPAFGPAVFTLAPSRARRLKKVNTMKKISTIIYDFKPVLRQVDDGDTRTVSVCMDCLPGMALFDLFPWLDGNIQLSHGICRAHQAARLAELDEMRVAL